MHYAIALFNQLTTTRPCTQNQLTVPLLTSIVVAVLGSFQIG